ncbi:MAG: imidazole glycerol phosphate synthase, glutamine amidotransferase subunit [Spirochaetes bacterium GWB1_48_6]|nr:MAG: imidazole glycerol phosphate synthase, glutamine amidotransferase subunit [Spirochaetes bacterium GWB1_48_6]
MKVGIVDYQAGNITSVERALEHLGGAFVTSCHPEELQSCDKLIIPGDGHATASMGVLKSTGLDKFIKEYLSTGAWVLGICIGCQIILDWSEEGDTQCMGLIPGTVNRFPERLGLKVPHMGWNVCRPAQPHHWLFKDVAKDSSFYYVHSYYTKPDNQSDILGICDYGINFASAIGRDNLAAVQFHPEKSGRPGLQMLKNFLEVK